MAMRTGKRRAELRRSELDDVEYGRRLAHRLTIVDTHVDVPHRLRRARLDISQRTEGGDFDYPRAVEGGLDAPFMSIFVGAEHQEIGDADEVADMLIDMVECVAETWPDKFALAVSPSELLAIVAEGRVALPMGMENAAPIGDDLGKLRHFHDRGVRYVTLTHSRNNQVCDSSYDPVRRWKGLSPFGRELVVEMNRLGMMIDVSHVSDASFEEVLELSRAPVIASHSSCRAFTPGWERNMSDVMIERLAAAGGVVQLNFGSPFLTREAQDYALGMFRQQRRFLDARGLDEDDPRAESFLDKYRAEQPVVLAELADVIAHIDHVVKLVGVDHVGFGSDFDGVGDLTPVGLEDVSKYPALLGALSAKGYSEEELAKICSGNILRVWAETERIAAELSG